MNESDQIKNGISDKIVNVACRNIEKVLSCDL